MLKIRNVKINFFSRSTKKVIETKEEFLLTRRKVCRSTLAKITLKIASNYKLQRRTLGQKRTKIKNIKVVFKKFFWVFYAQIVKKENPLSFFLKANFWNLELTQM